MPLLLELLESLPALSRRGLSAGGKLARSRVLRPTVEPYPLGGARPTAGNLYGQTIDAEIVPQVYGDLMTQGGGMGGLPTVPNLLPQAGMAGGGLGGLGLLALLSGDNAQPGMSDSWLSALGPQTGEAYGTMPDLVGNFTSNAQAGLEALLPRTLRPDPLAEAMAKDPAEGPKTADAVAQIIQGAPSAAPNLPRAAPLRRESREAQPIPEHRGRGRGVLLPAIDMSDPNWAKQQALRDQGTLLPKQDAGFQKLSTGLDEEKSRGVQSAGFDGSKFLDVIGEVLGAPMNILQRTIGAAVRGGPPGWLGQAQAADQAATMEIQRAQAEQQRQEEWLKANLPPELYRRIEPTFGRMNAFGSQRQGSDKAAGLNGNAEVGKPKQAGLWELLTTTYQDEGAELGRSILAKRGEAQAIRDRAKAMSDAIPGLNSIAQLRSNTLGADLDEKYAETERQQGIASKALGMEWTRTLIDQAGREGGGKPPKPPSLEQVRLGSKAVEDAISGKGTAEDWDEEGRRNFLLQLGGSVEEIPEEERWWWSDKYDWSKAQRPQFGSAPATYDQAKSITIGDGIEQDPVESAADLAALQAAVKRNPALKARAKQRAIREGWVRQ